MRKSPAAGQRFAAGRVLAAGLMLLLAAFFIGIAPVQAGTAGGLDPQPSTVAAPPTSAAQAEAANAAPVGGTTPETNAAPVAPPNPLVSTVEVGAGYSHYSGKIGDGNGEFVRFTLARPWRYSWTVDLGRNERFGEASLGYGLSFTGFLPHRWNFTVGAGSGTGDFLDPRYRVGASISGSVLGFVPSVGYLRDQSKKVDVVEIDTAGIRRTRRADAGTDALTVGLLRYAGHWIAGAGGRFDWGRPGNTHSKSGNVGLTWYNYRRTYVGIGYDFGDVSYGVIGTDLKMDYYSTGYNLGLSQWLTARTGFNLRASYGRTPYYNVRGGTVSFFWEF